MGEAIGYMYSLLGHCRGRGNQIFWMPDRGCRGCGMAYRRNFLGMAFGCLVSKKGQDYIGLIILEILGGGGIGKQNNGHNMQQG